MALAAQAGALPAQGNTALMPRPAHMTFGEGRLRLDTTFTARLTSFGDERLSAAVLRATRRLEARLGMPLSRSVPQGAGIATLRITVAGPGEAIQTPEDDESYVLAVTGDGTTLTAPTPVGALHGLETLLQLVTFDSAGFYLPVVRIDDAPRFRWRGLSLDVGRHFMPLDAVRRTLDGMAVVKLNVLHWHLSDDQGFRIESRRYPKLHQLGSDGLYYTQAEVREIVAYAHDRGIRVVPEFDMPGHATSWFVGYPEYASAPGPYTIERNYGVFDPAFDPTREETYQFIDGFIGEMVQLFPDPYWHIGGDEVTPTQWNRNPRILRFKREHQLKDNEALQAYFNQRLSRIITKYNRRMVGWDEILHENLPSTAIIQSWRGTEYMGQAARHGHRSILSAPYYLDHMKPTEEYYLADPLPAATTLSSEEQRSILGGEATLWAEHVGPGTIDSRLWPRLGAIAERFWSPQDVQDVDDMFRRLSILSIELESVGLGHEAHTERMLRLLTGQRAMGPLQNLLALTRPVTLGERGRVSGLSLLPPLTHLVDAANPDPWSRSSLVRQARVATGDGPQAVAARAELRESFRRWSFLSAMIQTLADTVPIAREGIPAATALGKLGTIGLSALDFLGGSAAPAGWKANSVAALDELGQPQGLLRLAGIDGVRVLITAVK
ncbi:MAG: family 20 glycosylhydrolase [Gemmatimonadales bacterium]